MMTPSTKGSGGEQLLRDAILDLTSPAAPNAITGSRSATGSSTLLATQCTPQSHQGVVNLLGKRRTRLPGGRSTSGWRLTREGVCEGQDHSAAGGEPS